MRRTVVYITAIIILLFVVLTLSLLPFQKDDKVFTGVITGIEERAGACSIKVGDNYYNILNHFDLVIGREYIFTQVYDPVFDIWFIKEAEEK